MPGVLRWLTIAVLLTALPVVAGVLAISGDEDAAPAPPPGYEAVPLEDYDTTTVAVARAPFCELLPDEAVADALGGREGRLTAYANGERADIAPGVEDVAHEYGCRLAGAGSEARAWLFAPPVTRTRAEELQRLATRDRGCEPQRDAPAYGDPSVALLCPAGKGSSASFRGLFGDAWLACSVTAPASSSEADLLARAGRFCVAVADAASAPRE